MSTLIHMNRTKKSSPIRETKASIVEGEISTVVREIIAHIEKSDACTVRETGGDWTGTGGLPRSLAFEVTVTLDDHEPMVWEHIVTEPGEPWKRVTIEPDPEVRTPLLAQVIPSPNKAERLRVRDATEADRPALLAFGATDRMVDQILELAAAVREQAT